MYLDVCNISFRQTLMSAPRVLQGALNCAPTLTATTPAAVSLATTWGRTGTPASVSGQGTGWGGHVLCPVGGAVGS